MRIIPAALAASAILLAACSARSIPTTADPSAAAAAIQGTAPDRPLRVVFDWRILERDARFNGSGAARIEPPYRARLDLFGPTGETYGTAVLLDQDLRAPGLAIAQLPPPALMWAVLGAVLPPDGAQLLGTREDGDRTELYYRAEGATLRYELRGGRLRTVEWEGEGRRMSVRLEGVAEPGLPRQAVYRDWSGYTELLLNLERVDEVEPYPPEIWTPGR